MRHSATAIAYNSGQKLPRTRNGKMLANFARSASDLSFIPDRTGVPVWDLLKEVVEGELGTMVTDEDGCLYFQPRASTYAPPDSVVTEIIPRKNAGPARVTPSANLYRNTVAMTVTSSQQIRGTVWQLSDPKQFWVPDGGAGFLDVLADDSMISAFFDCQHLSYIPATTGVPLDAGNWCAVTRADNVTLEQVPNEDMSVIPLADQRTIRLTWTNTATTFPLYFGCYKDANQAAWFVQGSKIDATSSARLLFADSTDVAAVGTLLLEIPRSDWLQSQDTASAISAALLPDLTRPAPLLDPLPTRPDPRRQIRDLVLLPGKPSMTGTLKCQVVGMKRSDAFTDAGGDFRDQVVLRVIQDPNTAVWDGDGVGWDLGTWTA